MHRVMVKAIGVSSILVFLFILSIPVVSASVETSSENTVEQGGDDSNVMQGFTSQDDKPTGVISVKDETKRLVMFVMGVPLLLLLATTVILGIAMGIYGKQVFVAHMICAGLSMTLAIAHAIVGIVWFYPF